MNCVHSYYLSYFIHPSFCFLFPLFPFRVTEELVPVPGSPCERRGVAYILDRSQVHHRQVTLWQIKTLNSSKPIMIFFSDTRFSNGGRNIPQFLKPYITLHRVSRNINYIFVTKGEGRCSKRDLADAEKSTIINYTSDQSDAMNLRWTSDVWPAGDQTVWKSPSLGLWVDINSTPNSQPQSWIILLTAVVKEDIHSTAHVQRLLCLTSNVNNLTLLSPKWY